MTISGIDEAGLGPILGPYCAASVRIEYRDKACVPQIKGLSVGDSKKIYSSGKISELEKTVLSFHSLKYSVPGNAYSFFTRYMDTDIFKDLPWLDEIKKLTLPVQNSEDELRELSGSLKSSLEQQKIRLSSLELTVQGAKQFNLLLDKYGNKASACQEILSSLIINAAENSDQLIVDRQGGRRYYGEWLISLFPGSPLRAEQELKEISRYRSADCIIDFKVKADADHFETALASMIAKYAREIYMKAFNNYWKIKAGELKETAGYYKDGLRFINDLKNKGLYPDDDSFLVRKK